MQIPRAPGSLTSVRDEIIYCISILLFALERERIFLLFVWFPALISTTLLFVLDGYLPLHWAVNQDYPNIDVIAALIAANASASAKACNKGSLPLHWCVNRSRPHLGVMRALLQVNKINT